MSRLNSGGLAGLGRGATNDRDAQYEALLRETAAAVERLGGITDQLAVRMQGHARDIESMRFAHERERAAAEQRFVALADEYQRGGSSHYGHFKSREAARNFGLLCIAALKDPDQSRAALDELHRAGINPGSGAAGGYLAPETVMNEIIRNVANAGVFERNCPPITTTVRSGGIPKRTAGNTVYFPDLETATTASAPTFGRVQFACKRWSALALVERWMLVESLAVALGEFVAEELAYAIAVKEDQSWFTGDGTSTYGGHKGLFKLASGDGISVVTGDSGDDTFAEVIAKSTYYLAQALGKLPDWAHMAGPRWYMHSLIFFQYLGVRDSQGMPIVNILNSTEGIQKYLFGYPVEWTQVAPSTTAVSTPFVVLAPLAKACRVVRLAGESVELRTSEHYKFAEGQVAFLADVVQDMVIADASAIVQIATAAS